MVVFILMALQLNPPPEKRYIVGVYATEAACEAQKTYWMEKTNGAQIEWHCSKWSVTE
jgi:hypothetical protein